MKAVIEKLGPSMLITAMVLSPMVARATTVTMSATYYTIAESDHDMNSLAFGVFANEVQNTLGQRPTRSQHGSVWLHVELFYGYSSAGGCDRQRRDYLVESQFEQGRKRRRLRRGPNGNLNNIPAL